jgi:uncharacterized protein (TIGR03086 family)
MNIKELFIKSNQALNDIVQQVKPEYLEHVMPRYASYTEGQLLRTNLNVYAHENASVPPMLAGKKVPNNQEFTEDYLKDDYKGNFAKLTAEANKAVQDCSEEDLNRTVHMSYADAPARDYLHDIVIQRSTAAIDIAQAANIPFSWPDEHVQAVLDVVKPFAATLREYGVFPDEVAVPDDAPLQDKLIALMGRQP